MEPELVVKVVFVVIVIITLVTLINEIKAHGELRERFDKLLKLKAEGNYVHQEALRFQQARWEEQKKMREAWELKRFSKPLPKKWAPSEGYIDASKS